MTLTDAGRYLEEHLPDFLHAYHQMCGEIRCIAQRETHEVHLLSAYGILRLVTPDCLAAFSRKYPHIHLTYREFPDRQVEQRFLDGEGDVAFTVGKLPAATRAPAAHPEDKLDALIGLGSQFDNFKVK